VLDREIGRCRLAALQRLAGDLAQNQERCQRPARERHGGRRLPEDLDRELHTLSLRLTADLDASLRAVVHRTLSAALGRRPDRRLSERVVDDVRAGCAERPNEVLLVTSNAGVTTMPSTYWPARFALARKRADGPIVRPIEVGLTAGCYVVWRKRTEVLPVEVSTWLQRALDSVAAELLNDVVQRCHEVHGVLVQVVAELVDAERPVPEVHSVG
jgi:hypothetical protein